MSRDWPNELVEPCAGWSFEGGALVGPDGKRYGPESPLSVSQAAELRGVDPRTVRRTVATEKMGSLTFVLSAHAAAKRNPAGRPKTKRAYRRKE